jgi:hypothetical protein
MSDSKLDTYLATIDARWHAMVVALDTAVREAAPELKPDIRYNIFMYGLNGDYRAWVCAISPTTKVVCLRFLAGSTMSDPKHLLRPGTSTLSTIDFKTIEEIDAQMVGEYVREAVAIYPAFKAAASKK